MPGQPRKQKRFKLTVPQTLVIGFAAFILCGAVILWLPASLEEKARLSFLDALFTSTSAVCVTGLVVTDTGSTFSRFGEGALVFLIQVGGLGIMTFSCLAILAAGGNISYRFRMLLKEQLNRLNMKSIVEVVRAVLLLTATIEGAAFIVLLLRWGPEYGWGEAAWLSFFHAVSAFCNAGFSLFPDNLMAWRGDYVINGVICALIVLGGIGFTVMLELLSWRRGAKLSLHSRVALGMTAALILIGAALIFVLEIFKAPGSIEYTGILDRSLTALFQSVTARTAGFNTIDIGAMSQASLFVIIILMYIGASPGGTGGGIKTTTFAALAAAVYSVIRGRQDVEIGSRRLSPELIKRSLTIGVLAQGLVWGVALACVAFAGGKDFFRFLFETMSAFGTVGLSMDLTPAMNSAQKILIIFTMFFGRLGPLTMAMAFAARGRAAHIRKPEAEILIG